MAKTKTQFVCQQCGVTYPRWQGQCTECGQWNTLVEETVETIAAKSPLRPSSEILTAFPDVKALEGREKRFSTSLTELVILLGGEPGIGKSTLMTQVAVNLLVDSPAKKDRWPILYVAGEESPRQISLRINRFLNSEHKKSTKKMTALTAQKKLKDLVFITSTDVDELLQAMRTEQPRLVVVDSIQAMSTRELTGASGSVGQLRESTERIAQLAKALHIPVFLIGHVTKEGAIAGPKVLEHIVDAVVEISGERSDQLRLVRALKNRFGATDEVGVFQHVEYGLEEVPNPSELFLEHQEGGVPGSATVCVMEGTRPLLIEVQALVTNSQLAMPRRVGRGIELSRIQVLCAVLQKHAGLPLGSNDVFLSAAGGFRVTEPAVDLGLAVAIASSMRGVKVPQKTIFIGEVGLLGEIRKVNYLERRIKEARRLGFTKIISRENARTVREVLKTLALL